MSSKGYSSWAHPYYDGGIVSIVNGEIPSKRVGYKNVDGVLIAKVPIGVPKFEQYVRDSFKDGCPNWPIDGKILVAINAVMPKKSYESKDVDNITKSLLDAFKGIMYVDDRDIDILYVTKNVGEKWSLDMAVKKLVVGEPTWLVNPLFLLHEIT